MTERAERGVRRRRLAAAVVVIAVATVATGGWATGVASARKLVVTATGSVQCGLTGKAAVQPPFTPAPQAGPRTVTSKLKATCVGTTGQSGVTPIGAKITAVTRIQSAAATCSQLQGAPTETPSVTEIDIKWKARGGKLTPTHIRLSSLSTGGPASSLVAPGPNGIATVTGSYADLVAALTLHVTDSPAVLSKACTKKQAIKKLRFGAGASLDLHPIVLPTPLAAGTNTSQPLNTIATNLLPRSSVDRPDEVAGYQVHAVYALPSDAVDRAFDTNGAIARSVSAFETWFRNQSGTQGFLLDTANGGGLDITFIRLPETDATIAATGVFVRDRIEALMRAAGLEQPNKLYAVYYDGTSSHSCGGGAFPPGLPGQVGAMYLRGLPNGPIPCATNVVGGNSSVPAYMDFGMLHELFHTLGAAPESAPHHVLNGHVNENGSDLMYAGPLPWIPTTLDIGNDDYWGHSNNCLDLADSTFVNPQPAARQLPPRWFDWRPHT